MKKIKTVLIGLLISSCTMQGCKKSEVTIQVPKEKTTDKVSVVELKKFMAELINVPVADITFSPQDNEFLLKDVKQINMEELTKIYNQSKITKKYEKF